MISFGFIASAIKKLKIKNNSTRVIDNSHPIHNISKEQFYKWSDEGKCCCCGVDDIKEKLSVIATNNNLKLI
jgi:hypothetical protein